MPTARQLLLLAAGLLACNRPPAAPPSAQVTRFAYVLDRGDASVSIFALDARGGGLVRRGHVRLPRPSAGLHLDRSGGVVLVNAQTPGRVAQCYATSYAVDAATGALDLVSDLPLAPSTSIGAECFATIHPTQDLLYAWDTSTHALNVLAFSPGTGALSPAAGSPGLLGLQGLPAFLPSGRFAVAPVAGGLGVFAVDGASGALSPVTGSPFGGGDRGAATVHPSGRFVYAVDPVAGGLWGYAVDPGTGALSAVAGAPFAATGAARSLQLDRSGRLAFAIDVESVRAWSVDPASGALTPLAGAPLALAGPVRSLTVDPAGRFAVAAVDATAELVMMAVGAGALVPPGPPTPLAGTVLGLDLEPAGERLLVRTSAGLELFDVQPATGTLTPAAALRTRRGQGDVAFGRGARPVTCSPGFAYVVNGGSSLTAWRVDAGTGVLSPAGAPFDLGAGAGAADLSVDPLGRRAVLAESAAGHFTTVVLDPLTGGRSTGGDAPVAVTAQPRSVALDPSGALAFGISDNAPAEGPLSVFALDPVTGAPSTPEGPYLAGSAASRVFLEPTGLFAYLPTGPSCTIGAFSVGPLGAPLDIAGSPWPFGGACLGLGELAAEGTGRFLLGAAGGTTSSLSVFSIDAGTGALTLVDNATLPLGPIALAADPLGKFAFVAGVSSGSGTIVAYKVDGAGQLTQVASVGAGAGASTLAMDPTGRFLLATETVAGRLHVYAVNRSSGALLAVAGSPFPAGGSPGPIAVTADCR